MGNARQAEFKLLRRLVREVGPYWPHITGIFLLSLLGSPLGLIGPLPLKIVVDSAIGSHPLPQFLSRFLPGSATGSPSAILAIAVFLLQGITAIDHLVGLANSFFGTYTSEKLLLNFRARLFSRMQRLSLSYHDAQGTADSVYRIQYDTVALQYLAIDGLTPFVTSTVTLAVMFYVTFRIDRQLALVA